MDDPIHIVFLMSSHWVGGNRKRYQQLTNVGQKSIETEFLIAICRQCGDKWQSKTLFLYIFYLRSSIVLVFSNSVYPVWSCGCKCSVTLSYGVLLVGLQCGIMVFPDHTRVFFS